MQELELIQRIKAAVDKLQWSDDWLALDKELGELDLLVYKLRQLVISPPPRERKSVLDLEQMLRDIGEDFVP